jgi:hypothetical protein
MGLTQCLQSLPPKQWLTHKAIILDWFDGPRAGVCALARPGIEFSFELLDERSNADDLDDRLFRATELPGGSVDAIWNSLAELGPPDHGIWVPVWKFTSELQKLEAERRVQEVLGRTSDAQVIVATRDMEHFLGCWPIDFNANGHHDWFSALGISQMQFSTKP